MREFLAGFRRRSISCLAIWLALAAASQAADLYYWGWDFPSSSTPQAVEGAPGFKSIATGGYYAFGLTESGEVYGIGRYRDMGIPDELVELIPNLPPMKAVAACWATDYRGIALSTTGTVYTLGDIPAPIPATANFTNDNVVSIAGNQDGWLAATADGHVFEGKENQAPVKITTFTGAVSVFAGRNMRFAITAGGNVYGWGDIPFEGTVDTPEIILSLPACVAIAAGSAHILALTSSGNVFAWGDNDFGQCGTGNYEDPDSNFVAPYRVATPTWVQGLPPIQSIAAGWGGLGGFSVAVARDGRVFTWGYNGSGCLGRSSAPYTTSPFPTAVPGLPPMQTAAAYEFGTWVSRVPPLLPTTTATLIGTPGDEGWYKGPVSVSLTATPGKRPVAKTLYAIGDGPWQTYSELIPLEQDGIHIVRFHSEDSEGSAEPEQSVAVKIDSKPPTVVFNAEHTKKSNATEEVLTLSGTVSEPEPSSGFAPREGRYTVKDSVTPLEEGETPVETPFPVAEDGSFNVIIPLDGSVPGEKTERVYEVRAQFRDVAGNVTEKTTTVRIRAWGPKFSIRTRNVAVGVRG